MKSGRLEGKSERLIDHVAELREATGNFVEITGTTTETQKSRGLSFIGLNSRFLEEECVQIEGVLYCRSKNLPIRLALIIVVRGIATILEFRIFSSGFPLHGFVSLDRIAQANILFSVPG